MINKLFCFFGFCCFTSIFAIDYTLIPKKYGSDVTQATVQKIQDSCIFVNDYQFMRRTAWVESKFGQDIDSSWGWDSPKGESGIWQVQPDVLDDVQKRLPIATKNQIQTAFEIAVDKLSINKGDLQISLYDGIIARSSLQLVTTSIPININQQAKYWQNYYNKGTAGTAQQFLDAIQQMPDVCPDAAADVLFIVDSSSSIGATTFNLVRQFVTSVISKLTIGEQHFKIAVDDFSSRGQFSSVIKFNDYSSDKQELLKLVSKIPYYGQNTDMSDAIDLSTKYSFSLAHGARRPGSGIPKVAILITDGMPNDCGQSDCKLPTRQAASRMRDSGIELYTVGVGDQYAVDTDLLYDMSSDPKCMHTYLMDSYNDLAADFPQELKARSCTFTADAPEDGNQISNSISKGQVQYVKFAANASTGITFHLTDVEGSSILYISLSEIHPSAQSYEYNVNKSNSFLYLSPKDLEPPQSQQQQQQQGRKYLRISDNKTKNSTVPVYSSIQGIQDTNNFTIEYDQGNTVPKSAETVPIKINAFIFMIIAYLLAIF